MAANVVQKLAELSQKQAVYALLDLRCMRYHLRVGHDTPAHGQKSEKSNLALASADRGPKAIWDMSD